MDLHATHAKRKGEDLFGLIFLVLSVGLFWQSYKIAGFSALSSPGAFPMAASGVMTIAAAVVVIGNLRRGGGVDPEAILPMPVFLFMALLLAYALLLAPLGFLPASYLFLLLGTQLLGRGSLLRTALLSAATLAVIYVVFRIVFQVVLPEGIVPETDILSSMGRLFSGGEAQ
jgi:hypothetical protein